MVEVFLRAGAAVLLALGAWWSPQPAVLWTVAGGLLLVSMAVWRLQPERRANPGIGGFIAVADSWMLALAIGTFDRLDTMGFFVLIPCVQAAVAYGSLSSAMAPLAAGSLMAAHAVTKGGPPDPSLYGQVLGVLGIGLMAAHQRIVVTESRDVVGVVDPESPTEPDGFLALRENFRELRDRYQRLETRSRKDRIVAEILGAKLTPGPGFADRLALKLKEVLGVHSISIFRVARFEKRLVVTGTTHGDDTDTIELDMRGSLAQLRDRAERAIRRPEDPRGTATIPLVYRGKVTALLVLRGDDKAALVEAADLADRCASLLAEVLEDEERSRSWEHRARMAETLYEAAVVTHGAATPTSIAERICREIFATLAIDHLAVHWLDGTESLSAVSVGEPMRLLDALSFMNGPGLGGWLQSGAPEVVLFVTSEDPRCSAELAVRRRIGSFAIFPIAIGDSVIGFVTAGSKRGGGIDVDQVEILRMAIGEMSQAIARLRGATNDGLMTPSEFAGHLSGVQGKLVVIEPLRQQELVERYGKPAMERATREYARRVKGMLPPGAAICRRGTGSLLVFLGDVPRSMADSWANECAASASMLSTRTPDGRAWIPFAVIARVMEFGTQSSEFSMAEAS